ncbi:DgyrCDS1708 [Dimorphilus gyrociliatus]|uniref:DgyrCDS1708 n=1 Tax=Dimorphilus gyrociliatus TaxID=2664684 RepID=A0A7I8VA90_9ANNE|nr:DgyrCDS1708 [Dimorphilus gyrociliatus]
MKTFLIAMATFSILNFLSGYHHLIDAHEISALKRPFTPDVLDEILDGYSRLRKRFYTKKLAWSPANGFFNLGANRGNSQDSGDKGKQPFRWGR